MKHRPFYGVNGQPFLDLTPHISVAGLDEVSAELAELFVRHGPFHTIRFDENQDLVDELSPERLGFDCRHHPQSRWLENATAEQVFLYNSFFEPVLPNESFVHLMRENEVTPWAKRAPLTMEWATALPVDVGRVTVYFARPGQSLGAHRDTPVYLGYNAPLIYVNPLLKPFYVIGPEGERHYVDTPIAHFNNQDFHGLETHNCASFSIRIGGNWHDDLLDATGLRDHFKRSS